MTDTMDIFVPREPRTALASVDPGSGIVGSFRSGERVLVYYEGNRYGYANVVTWADRVRIAAGRCRERYPTIACCAVPAAGVVKVGEIASDLNRLVVTDRAELSRWLGQPARLDRELEFS